MYQQQNIICENDHYSIQLKGADLTISTNTPAAATYKMKVTDIAKGLVQTAAFSHNRTTDMSFQAEDAHTLNIIFNSACHSPEKSITLQCQLNEVAKWHSLKQQLKTDSELKAAIPAFQSQFHSTFKLS